MTMIRFGAVIASRAIRCSTSCPSDPADIVANLSTITQERQRVTPQRNHGAGPVDVHRPERSQHSSQPTSARRAWRLTETTTVETSTDTDRPGPADPAHRRRRRDDSGRAASRPSTSTPPPASWSPAAGAADVRRSHGDRAETAGGIGLILGLLTPLAACAVIAAMIDAWAVNVSRRAFWSEPFNVPFLLPRRDDAALHRRGRLLGRRQGVRPAALVPGSPSDCSCWRSPRRL